MQFTVLLLAFWMPILLALKAGVSAAPIPELAPRVLNNRSEVTIEERAPEAAVVSDSEPMVYERESRIGRRQSRAVRRAVGSQEHKRAASAQSELFPVQNILKSWTTSSSGSSSRAHIVLPLSNDVFRASSKYDNMAKAHPHPIVEAPDGTQAMRASYAKGTYTYKHGSPAGFSFYGPGHESVSLKDAKEAILSYKVYVPEDFDFVKGGKLPGFYGGNSEKEAVGCSGGRRDDSCFSARFMWRAEGAGELYTYLPPSFEANKKFCDKKNYDCNPTYGASIARDSFKFARGAWTTIAVRVKLNDSGKKNGEFEMYANNESVAQESGLVWRNGDEGRIRGLQMQTFFGGSKPEFQASKKENLYFKDFSVGITQFLY